MKIILLSIFIICVLDNFCMATEETYIFGDLYLNEYKPASDQKEFMNKLNNFDLSDKLKGYLTGVFGKNYTKIDFYLEAKKDHTKLNYYLITGLCRLNGEIKPITGTMQLGRVSEEFSFQEPQDVDNSIHILYFKYEFRERDSGVFFGYASIVDYFEDKTKKPTDTWFASDFSGTQKMFVGNWRSNQSKNIEKCIFSYDVCCVSELPFSSDFYYYPSDENNDGGYQRIKPEYDNPEWSDYSKPTWANEISPTKVSTRPEGAIRR